MTAQWHDSFIYEDEDWDIVGINGKGFFNPNDYGLNPVGACSACWCGFLCTYKISQREIVLDKLDINHAEGINNELEVVRAPSINGIEPIEPSGEHTLFESTFIDLNLKINFSGGIVIAKDFIDDLYIHMGYHPAWKYKKVIELIFENGTVIATRDVSEKMKESRKKMIKEPLEPGTDASKEEIHKWIEDVFKLKYE